MNEMHNYSINKQRAIEQMLDMNKRAKKFDSSAHNSQTRGTLPFLNLPLQSDTLVILALMLILYNDNTDMLLIFALAYILI